MAQGTDFSVVNLILRKLDESRTCLNEQDVMRSLVALTHTLKLRISHEFREENQELIDAKIHRIAAAITKSSYFESKFGPVSFAQGDNKTMYDFMNSLISAEMEISESDRADLLAKATELLIHGKFDEARDVINNLLISLPDDIQLRMDVGDKYLSHEMYEDAELVFREAQTLSPESIQIINRLGIAFRKMGRYDDAIAEYIRAIKIASNDPHLYYNLAVALYSKNDLEKALKTIERALTIEPGFGEGKELKRQIEIRIDTPQQ